MEFSECQKPLCLHNAHTRVSRSRSVLVRPGEGRSRGTCAAGAHADVGGQGTPEHDASRIKPEPVRQRGGEEAWRGVPRDVPRLFLRLYYQRGPFIDLELRQLQEVIRSSYPRMGR